MNLTDRDKQFVQEALNRGASERLLLDYFEWRSRYQTSASYQRIPGLTPSLEPDLRAKPAQREDVRRAIEPLVTAFYNRVRVEFRSLTINFADPDRERTPEEHYFYMRPMYYLVGFDNPAQAFLSKITSFNFLGKNVPGGVHEALIPGLNQVAALLNQVSPGLSDQVAGVIRSQDAGFVPRRIAGSSELSNHAFGLAIDLDPPTNPHIKGKVIPLLNEVVKSKIGLHFDFGSQYGVGKDWSNILTDRQRLQVTYSYASRASNAVQDFLRENLDTYDQCRREVTAGKSQNANAADKENARQAQFALDNERELKLISLLENEAGRATLNAWREGGVQSLPYELVWALKNAFASSPYFRWGQEYQSSKDAMHFELRAFDKNKDGSITPATLIPDATRVRPLDDVLNLQFLAFHAPGLDDFFVSKQQLETQPYLAPRTYY